MGALGLPDSRPLATRRLAVTSPDRALRLGLASLAARDRTRTVEFAVLGDPLAMPRPRVVSQRGRVHGYIPTAAARACWEIRLAAAQALGSKSRFAGPVRLTVTAYVRQPTSIPKRDRLTALPVRRPDVDNFAKTVLDGLSVLWRDDSQVTDLIVRKRYAVDSSPRWEIRVEDAV